MILVGIQLTSHAPDNADFPKDPPGTCLYLSPPTCAGVVGVIYWLERRLQRPANHFALREKDGETYVLAVRQTGQRPSSVNPPVVMAEVWGLPFADLAAARLAAIGRHDSPEAA
jgi:hypothetical protein